MKTPQVHRHRTAIGREGLSKPFRVALEANLISATDRVFDYGCGRGDDLRHLIETGIVATGWDPAHRPGAPRQPADVVNLGYVVNVIEDSDERAGALRAAWGLSERLLIVSARLEHESRSERLEGFRDGFLTARGTFQKFFSQLELRDWIDQTLEQRCIAGAPGIFFVFRDETLRQTFLETRYRRARAAPKPRVSDVLFEQHQALLAPLTEFVAERGRLPEPWELTASSKLEKVFGSVPRAFAVIRRVTGNERWDQLREERHEELLIRFALDRFGGRPKFSELPPELQLDVREFFSTYTKACAAADSLLFRAGKMPDLEAAMRQSSVGKLTGNALYVYADAVPYLPTLLRIYEGCARVYLGYVEGANIIKLSRDAPKVSYLFYPDFDTDPHPALRESLRLRLGSTDVKYIDYRDSTNPPILHRKEDFLRSDDPRRERFAKLTAREEKAGLYADPEAIGTRDGWTAALARCSVRLRGHQLISAKAQ